MNEQQTTAVKHTAWDNSIFNYARIREVFQQVQKDHPELREADQINQTMKVIHERAPISGAFINIKGRRVEYKRATVVKALRGQWQPGPGNPALAQIDPSLIYRRPYVRKPQPEEHSEETAQAGGGDLDAILALIAEQTDVLGKLVETQDEMQKYVAALMTSAQRIEDNGKAAQEAAQRSNTRIAELATAFFRGATGALKTELARLSWITR